MESLILVTGHPGTGKTTLARAIAPRIGFPLLEKDVVKEALHRVLPANNLEDSRRLGAATYEVMYSLAERMMKCILESNFDPARARRPILDLHPQPLELFCHCDPELALARYAGRSRGGPHFDDEMLPRLHERLAGGQSPLALGGPVLDIDTTDGIDVEAIVEWVETRLRGG